MIFDSFYFVYENKFKAVRISVNLLPQTKSEIIHGRKQSGREIRIDYYLMKREII